MKGILFDNDGTLVDTHGLILSSMRYSTVRVLDRVIPDEVLLRKVGQPLAVQMGDFTSDEDEQAEILRVYREHNHAIHDEMVKAFPGVSEMLREYAARGVKLGVVTSKMHELAWRGLVITGLSEFLECCIGADDCVRFKPEAEPVERGLKALGLQPDECLYVGDSPYDLQAGKAAGCRTVAVTWGMFPRDVLAAENPDYLCDNPADLLALPE